MKIYVDSASCIEKRPDIQDKLFLYNILPDLEIKCSMVGRLEQITRYQYKKVSIKYLMSRAFIVL